MKRWERWAFNALHGTVAVTGAAYFHMRYVMTPSDPFAVINHPWQPGILALHLLAAPVFIALFGVLFRSHTVRKLASPNPANRRSGWMSLVSFSAMALSGYLVQVISSPAWLTSMVWVHIATSVIFVAGYGVHLVIGWQLTRTSSAVGSLSEPARMSP